MKIQNIDLFLYSLLWMFFMFVTVKVTDGKLGLTSPNMPKEVMQKVEYTHTHSISKNKTTKLITTENKKNKIGG